MDDRFVKTIDLEIENYDLIDILKLFNLEYNFDKSDLKEAKKIALMTHPDKSGLDKKYFLFFSAAYKIVYEIYSFRTSKNQSTTYDENSYADANTKNEKITELINDKKLFNKLFNDFFEKSVIKDEYSKTGYGDWFGSGEDIDDRDTTMENMNNMFERKKTELRSIVVHKDFNEMTSSGFCDLTNSKPESYSSDLFSKLQYEDLKKAHTETVVPVNMEDYKNKKKYRNVNELQQDRSIQNKLDYSHLEHQKHLDEKHKNEAKNDVERAYKLLKSDIEIEKVNRKWWGNILK